MDGMSKIILEGSFSNDNGMETENFLQQKVEEIFLEGSEIDKLIEDFLYKLEEKYTPTELANYISYHKIKGQEIPEGDLNEDLPHEDSIARFLESLR